MITDGADAMVEAAKAHVEASGADNVEVRQMEAEWLDVPTALVRRGPEPLGLHAARRSRGRAARGAPRAAARAAGSRSRSGRRSTENPWIGVVQRELVARELAPRPAPGTPGMFALAAPGDVEELLAAAGFADVARRAASTSPGTPASLDAWWDHQRTVSISLGAALDALTPAEHYELRDAVDAGYAPYVAADGSVALPARALVASADA